MLSLLHNYKSYTQAGIMSLVSACSLFLSLYFAEIFDQNNFVKYSYFIFIIPILQAILSFNSLSLISIKILSGTSTEKVVSFYISLSILTTIVLLTSIAITFSLKTTYIYDIHLILLALLLTFIITLNDIHHQVLLANELSRLSYIFYLAEKIILIIFSIVLNATNNAKFEYFLIFYILTSLIIFILRTFVYRISNYKFKYFLIFLRKKDKTVNLKYLFASILLYLLSYISSNIDRFISSLFLNSEIFIIYTQVFLILSGSNMLAQSLIIANLKKIYVYFTESSNLEKNIKLQAMNFFLVGFISSLLILLLTIIYDLFIMNEANYRLLIIFILCAPSSWIMISNKPYGLYIDFKEIINIKLIASFISIVISLILYFMFKDFIINIYLPAIILLASSCIFANIIKYYTLSLIASSRN
jgi:O-antigen/teichoic acid export membrane protein